jgi:hypothetical protein
MPFPKYYTEEEICELLEKAVALGFDLDKDSLRKITLEQLEKLVTYRM